MKTIKELAKEFAENWTKPKLPEAEISALEHAYETGAAEGLSRKVQAELETLDVKGKILVIKNEWMTSSQLRAITTKVKSLGGLGVFSAPDYMDISVQTIDTMMTQLQNLKSELKS